MMVVSASFSVRSVLEGGDNTEMMWRIKWEGRRVDKASGRCGDKGISKGKKI